MARRGALGSALLLLSPLALAAAEATAVRSYPLAGHGVLELAVPPSWKESVSHPPADLPPTIEFSPAAGNDFSVQVTPLWSPGPDPEFNRPDVIRPLIESIGRKQLEQAIETEIALKEIKGPQAAGYFFTVTDRAPAEAEWKYLTAGAAGVGDLLLSFTILTNSLDSGERDQALKIIEGSRQAPDSSAEQSPAAAPAPATLRKLTYPGKRWSLVLDLPGFEFQERATRQDMTGVRILGENKSTGVLISVHLEKAARAGDAKAARAYYWSKVKKIDPKPKDVVFSERDDMALVDHRFPSAKGVEINQRQVNAYMSHDGIWADIQLSKAGSVPGDRDLFDTILRSARIVEPAPIPDHGSARETSPVSSVRTLPVIGKSWGLVLDTTGASLTTSPLYSFDEKDGQVVRQNVIGSQWKGGSEKTGLVFSIMIGAADTGGLDAQGLRNHFWHDLLWESRGQMTDVRRSERGEVAILEAMEPRSAGRKADIKHATVFLSREETWIVVSVSKVDYRPEDAAAFEAVLKSIRIDSDAAIRP